MSSLQASPEEDLRSDTWEIKIELVPKSQKIPSIAFSFRHLQLINHATFSDALSKPPDVTFSGFKKPDDNATNALSSTELLNHCCLESSHISLDLSRNFFRCADIPFLIRSIAETLHKRELFTHQNVLTLCANQLRTLCLTSNELQEFPKFIEELSIVDEHSEQHSLATAFPSLQELYINHNFIETIQCPTNSKCKTFVSHMPQLRTLELRNNRLVDIKGLSKLLHNHPTLNQ